jgi:hypothetical protein
MLFSKGSCLEPQQPWKNSLGGGVIVARDLTGQCADSRQAALWQELEGFSFSWLSRLTIKSSNPTKSHGLVALRMA